MDSILSIISLPTLIGAIGVTLVAGVVKGAIGFAMPLIMISGIGLLVDPKLAIAGIILPIVLSNLLQVMKAGFGEAKRAVQDFAVYISIVCITIVITAQFVSYISTETMFLVLGVPVTILCVIQLLGVTLSVPKERHGVASVVLGLISGALGGFAGTWGPTTVLYLVALDTPKKRQIAVQGVIYGLGSVMLLIGHLKSGILNASTAPFSVILLLPAVAGMWLGFKIQDRIDQATFKKVTLVVLLVAGLNLIRRGLM